MALVQKRDTRKTILSAVLLVAILLGGGVAYWLLTRNPVSRQAAEFRRSDLPILTTFGEEVLRSERVQSLQSYGDVPVEVEPYGNENPFEPRF